MADEGQARGGGPVAPPFGLPYRLLRLFADIRQGEAPKALLLALNVFLLLLAYYILKPLREALLLVDKDAPAVKSYLGGAQAVLFIFVIKAFSRLASRVPRHVLITRTTLFFASNLVVFYVLNLGGVPTRTMGILFFVWIGVFNYFVIAQFWGFANDLYTDETGKRTFPLVAFGATLGGVVGTLPVIRRLRDLLGAGWEYKLMLLAGALLLACIALAVHIHRRDVRKTLEAKEKGQAGAEERARVQAQPLKAGGGFRLVFKSRYLLLIALMIGIYNYINATGEYIITAATVKANLSATSTGATGAGPSESPQAAGKPAATAEAMKKSIHKAFMDYQFLTNIIALIIQLFLVSRIFKWIGVGGALLFLPLIALGGYALISFGAVLAVVRWVKSLENGTDYSLQNTTKAALFLVTPREEKYKAKAAIDTFFVRGGDTVSALTVLVGTQILALKIEKYAYFNIVGAVVLIGLCVLIIREHRRLKARASAA